MRKEANEGKQRNMGQTKQRKRQREEQRKERTVFRDSGKPMETYLTEGRKLNMRKREKTEDNSSFSLKSIHHFRSDETPTLRFFFLTMQREKTFPIYHTKDVSSSL